LEASYILAKRGHKVDIYEASDKICGGQLEVATLPPNKNILNFIPDFYSEQLSRFENVDIHLNTPITAENINKIKADTVLLATGAKPLIPKIPGCENKNVYTAEEVLRGKVKLSGKVVVAGGGQIGGETAHFLIEKGCQVTIIEMLPEILVKEELITKLTLLNILQIAGVEILINTKITKFTKNSVEATNLETGETANVACDYIVMAFGTVPENSLYEALSAKFDEVITIGDADTVGKVQTAIHSGFFAGLEV